MARKAETTLTYAVTFQAPANKSLKEIRLMIVEAMDSQLAGHSDLTKLKVHLTNKETSYGKR